MKIAAKSKLVMIGDSITDTGRAQGIAEGDGNLGSGYVRDIDALLSAVYPDYEIRVVNVGCSGNRVRDLATRWQHDVLDQKPDWLSIMIGANDVWRQFDRARQPEIHVLADEYDNTLNDLVTRTRPLVKGLILLTPFFIDPNKDDAMRRRMDEYGAIIKKIARANDAILVDTQAAYDTMLRHVHSYSLSADRIHPRLVGHMVLARAFLNAIDFDWSRKLS